MILITSSGNLALVWIAIGLGFSRTNRVHMIPLVMGILITSLLCDGLLKNLIQRQRPFIDYPIAPLIARPNSYSMPSGHAATSFAAAVILSHFYPHYTPWFFLLASLIALSRVYVGVHFMSDVVVGALLGIVIALILLFLFKR